MTWRYELTGPAMKDLRKLDKTTAGRVLDALDRLQRELGEDASPAQSDVRRIEGTADQWRLRIGDYRARFSQDAAAQVVTVLHVRHRREAYR
jgi:mRNA interferase RelE/StbE